jgi:O-antigen biosynthesis protein
VFPNLPNEPVTNGRRAAHVCIATYEILGPSQNGGIGTAYYSLATTLAAANQHVTILYLWAERSDEAEMRHWQSHFRTLGIEFVPLPRSPRTAAVPDCMLTACDAHAWLRKRHFDVVHFPDLHGHGYYCVLAKHQRLDFNRTILCIGTHSPISWIREQNKEAPYSPDELEMGFMERQSVALADVVVSPSQYMLGWMQRRGWLLPVACYVQQNIAPLGSSTLAKAVGSKVPEATELVFFGRLEARKGIGLFCDALDLVEDANLPTFSVSFLGKNGRIAGRDAVSYLRARAQHWRFHHRILSDYTREAAIQYLAENAGRIAIVPSFEDNLPYTVVECLATNIPFLAGRSGGIPELVADSDLEQVTFPLDAAQLADRLARAIRHGVPVARPAISADENRQRWINWHAALAAHNDRTRETKDEVCSAPAQPLVTVCLNYRGERESLPFSLASLRRQSYARLEVLLLDRSHAGAEAELDAVMHDFAKSRRLIRRATLDSGAALSPAAADLRGVYVLFMEASDYLEPDAIALFVKVASYTGANVLTCLLALFKGGQEPSEKTFFGYYPFLSGALISGVFNNRFGARAIFVQKDALLRLGEFPDNHRRDCSDWEFLARAALARCQMEVIPVPLAWYRIGDRSRVQMPAEYLDQVQALTPYEQAMPMPLRGLPQAMFTMGLHYQRIRARLADDPMHMILQRLGAHRKNDESDSGLADEDALLQAVNRMPAQLRKKLALLLDGWLEYSSTRSQLPPPGFRRISRIARHLLRGHYHRYGHGLGSALRDLRKPVGSIKKRGKD